MFSTNVKLGEPIPSVAKLRAAYKPLFTASEYAWKLDKKELQSKLKTLLGAAEGDKNIPYVAATFLELSKLANWSGTTPKPKKDTSEHTDGRSEAATTQQNQNRETHLYGNGRLGLSYTINLNLPATTEIEVFNAIFKSLRENLLSES
jgi:hypothetical protein